MQVTAESSNKAISRVKGDGRRHRFTDEFKREMVLEFHNSSLSYKAKLHGIGISTFFRWRRAFHKGVDSKELKPTFEKGTFIPIEVRSTPDTDKSSSSQPLTLWFRNEVQLHIPEGFHAPTLKRVIEVLGC